MSAPQHPPAGSRQGWRTALRRVQPYLFVSPFFVLFAVFGLFPMLFSIGLSLVAAVIPARHAARTVPAEGLRPRG